MNKVKIGIINRFQIQLGLASLIQEPAPSGNDNSHPLSEQVEIQTHKMDQVDLLYNFMLENPIYIIAFLTEVISQTIMAKETN